MKKFIFVLSIFALLNSCSKTEDPVINWYYIEATATCKNPPDIYTYNTTTRVGYVTFGYFDSVNFGYITNPSPPSANKWYKTNTLHISAGQVTFVPVYIKMGTNNSPVPSNERIKGILPYEVSDFKEYNSPCQ
jgi:hypothetical protein